MKTQILLYFTVFLISVATLASCSSEEPGGTSPLPEKSTGYLAVRLIDAYAPTRAGEDSCLEQGDPAEATVVTASFHFYDSNGIYMLSSSDWQGGIISDTEDGDANIEFDSNTIVILKGLQTNEVPCYVVTVLNPPADFKPGRDLKETEMALSSLADSNGGIVSDGHFIMATTSYLGESSVTANGQPIYFTTAITPDNFTIDTDDVSGLHPLDIHVERLAAKVTMRIAVPTTRAGENVIPLRLTFSGTTSDTDPYAPEAPLDTQWVYVRFTNWALTSTAKHSYMLKTLPHSAWKPTDLGFEWNFPELFRCYWGESWTYGIPGIKDPITRAIPEVRYNYTNHASLFGSATRSASTGFGGSLYCAENTHPEGEALSSDNFGASVTSIILGAQVFADPECTKPLDLILSGGIFYTQVNYMKFLAYTLNSEGRLNYWTKTGETTFRQVGPSHFRFTDMKNGNIGVEFGTSETLYRKSGDTFVPYDNQTEAIETLNASLRELDPKYEAMIYQDGYMYYCIPIQHLNKPKDANGNYDPTAKLEGQYGVVRNHHYNIVVNILNNMGRGVFDPAAGELVIPPDPTDPKYNYQVGATIDILPWKIVSQSGIVLG